ncbi:hypothetical protein RN001_009845 [Aquatica leii]|uniref:Uncharacterized protein n=1 Tax=Aquatica leii TaxID=1421715 RepID=A0AAN7PU61_9COLE|nr:hypothetical protein RN001_009845 [Aquatica leii]
MYEHFNKKHIKWLNVKYLKLPEIQPSQPPSSVPKCSEQKKRDGPNKLFEESCQRSKQRHVKPFVSSHTSEELCVKSGERATAQVVKLAIQSSVQNVKEYYNEIQTQILQLEPTIIVLGTKEIKFKHIPICTMLDGKTINILTDTLSSQACNVCKATPKDLNDLEKLKNRVCDEDTFKFGISILHAHLKCYEYLLHIAYKLELQQWQARGENAKEKVKEKKVK